MSTIIEEIKQLKKEKNAVILAHYYQRPEVQEVADFVGDSYYLSKIAKECRENTIVFCGVKFMAESAKILSPEKTVLLPASDAGCPMADMAEENKLLELKKKYPYATTVCYINSTTEVKALCDVTVTSSNALKIINNIKSKQILFLPDKNLGGYLAKQCPDKEFILWDGFCITHKKVKPEYILKTKELVPDALVLSHPECEEEILEISDYIGSTGGILDYATKSHKNNFIIVTEDGILHKLKKNNPNKNFYVPGSTMTCINMKKTRIEDVRDALLKDQFQIHLDESIRVKALSCLKKMHELAD